MMVRSLSVRTWLVQGRAVDVSLGPQQLVHADGVVSPLRRCTSATEKAEHEQAHQWALRRHCVHLCVQQLSIMLLAVSGAPWSWWRTCDPDTLNSRAKDTLILWSGRKSRPTLAEEAKTTLCVSPSEIYIYYIFTYIFPSPPKPTRRTPRCDDARFGCLFSTGRMQGNWRNIWWAGAM